MDAYRAIVTKRDRREFDSRPIAEETVRRILQAGRMAGSSRNSQPLRFVVMRNDRARVEALALCTFGGASAPMTRAPLVVAALAQEGGGDFDVGRALQNMFVAAWAEGVISVPQGIRDAEAARQALGAPAEMRVAMAAAFGYPSPPAAKPESRPRLPFDEVVHWEKW